MQYSRTNIRSRTFLITIFVEITFFARPPTRHCDINENRRVSLEERIFNTTPPCHPEENKIHTNTQFTWFQNRISYLCGGKFMVELQFHFELNYPCETEQEVTFLNL